MPTATRLLTVIAFACATFGASSAQAAKRNFCQLTATHAIESCVLAARSDDTLALGKCANATDAAARTACLRQASADHRDALQTCEEALRARKPSSKELCPFA